MTGRSGFPPTVLVTIALAAVALTLAGCTPLGTVLGAATTPGTPSGSTTSAPVPQPSATAVIPVRPTSGAAGCTLSAAGSYQVADCTTLQVSGTGITVAAGNVGSVRIDGDRNVVLVDTAPGVQISGQDNKIVVGTDIGGVDVRGDRNQIAAGGRIGSGTVAGNDNVLTAPDGVGDVKDDGARNSIGARP